MKVGSSLCGWQSGETDDVDPKAYLTVKHFAFCFVTPNTWGVGYDRANLTNSANLFATARAQTLQRWSEKTLNWQPAGSSG